jgi:type IV pilus assembly protein PilA
MFKLINKARKNEKGFTLVELMVVVVIIGVLVAIAVPVYQNVVTGAEERAVEANERIINSAISMYSIENQETDLSTLDIDAATVPGELAPYLQEWPTGPGGRTYIVTDGKAVVVGP